MKTATTNLVYWTTFCHGTIELNQQKSRSTPAREYVVDCGSEHNRMKYIAAGVIGQMSDAEDVVQQAYSIAIEKNQCFDTRDQFLGWLAGIVKCCALNVRRKRIRRKTSSVDPAEIQNFVVDEKSEEKTSKIDGRDLETLKDSFDDDVMSALENISEDARTCMLLKSVENLSYKEISTLMKIPEGTAMSMVHRARTSLRRDLASHDFARTADIGTGRNQ